MGVTLDRRLPSASELKAIKLITKALLSNGLIEFTIPDEPHSRVQKYRLARRGGDRTGEVALRAAGPPERPYTRNDYEQRVRETGQGKAKGEGRGGKGAGVTDVLIIKQTFLSRYQANRSDMASERPVAKAGRSLAAQSVGPASRTEQGQRWPTG